MERIMDINEYKALKAEELKVAEKTVEVIKNNPDPFVQYRDRTAVMDLKHMIGISAEKFGDRPAFWSKPNRKSAYQATTYKQYLNDINCLGTALISMGLKDKRIAVIGHNCYQWAVAYMAAVCGVGVVVPLDKELSPAELKQLVIEADVSCVIMAKKHKKSFIEMMESGDTKIEILIDMQADTDDGNVRALPMVLELGADLMRSGDTSFTEAQIYGNEMSILLFTSGTTGISKGVMLSHRNICEDLMIATSVLKVNPEDVFFSVLPLHHTYACTCDFLTPLYCGASIAYCEGLKYIVSNLAEARPTMFLGVPAVFEMLYKKIWSTARKNGKEKALKTAIKISRASLKVGIDLRKKLFKDIHATLGGRMRVFICGGAAINPEVLDGFRDFGIVALQGYGLTEAAPMGALNPDTAPISKSIGRGFPNCGLKIFEPDEEGIGEICLQGANIMLGYFKRQDLTDEVIIDGWFHTGDIGYIDDKGYAYITGRKKNVIITKNGKNVFPEELEYYLSNVPMVQESVVFSRAGEIGEDDVIAAYIKLYDEYIEETYGADPDEDKILEDLWKEVDKINAENPLFKQIKVIKIKKEEFAKNSSKKIVRFNPENKF